MSGYGLRIRDPATGDVIIDYTDSLTLTLGRVSTTTAAGSVTDAALAGGLAWAVIEGADFDRFGKTITLPARGGTTISWTASNFSADIIYGLRS